MTVLQDTTLEPEISSAAIFARVVDAISVEQGQNTAETAENLSLEG